MLTELTHGGRGICSKMLLALGFVAAGVIATGPGAALAHAMSAQAAATASTKDIAGTWQGTMHPGRDVRMVLKISKSEGGGYTAVFTNADQGGSIPVSTLTLQDGTVKVTSPALGTVFEGKLGADGKTIDGNWNLAPNPLPLTLTRATPETEWSIAPPPARIPPMAADANPSFEVATIKPNDSGATRIQGLVMRGRTFLTRASSLEDLISFAYDVQTKQIVNGPSWMDTERYDIEAVPDAPGTPNTEQIRIMIRKLLTDRFKLSFHQEKRELPAYVLTVGKNGEKLTPTEAKGQLPGLGFGPGTGGLTLHVMNATMSDFTGFLQILVLDRPVVDRTGLAGRYDFQCTFAPDESEFGGHPPRFPAPGESNGSTGSTADTATAPGLFDAVQQQLGLKLSAEKTDVNVIAIDHVDHPSPN